LPSHCPQTTFNREKTCLVVAQRAGKKSYNTKIDSKILWPKTKEETERIKTRVKIVSTPRMNERRKTKNKSWGGK
jgi:hypothetical protein